MVPAMELEAKTPFSGPDLARTAQAYAECGYRARVLFLSLDRTALKLAPGEMDPAHCVAFLKASASLAYLEADTLQALVRTVGSWRWGAWADGGTTSQPEPPCVWKAEVWRGRSCLFVVSLRMLFTRD